LLQVSVEPVQAQPLEEEDCPPDEDELDEEELDEDELLLDEEEGVQVRREALQAVVLPGIQQVPIPFTQVTTSAGLLHEQFGSPDEQATPLELLEDDEVVEEPLLEDELEEEEDDDELELEIVQVKA